MKLLLDENLSPRLVDLLRDVIRDFSASMDDGLLVLEMFTGQD